MGSRFAKIILGGPGTSRTRERERMIKGLQQARKYFSALWGWTDLKWHGQKSKSQGITLSSGWPRFMNEANNTEVAADCRRSSVKFPVSLCHV